ncbi:MAG: anaerobic ribonucleoside-triphosphate reductase [Candidatus Hermodarchaeota archaeon]
MSTDKNTNFLEKQLKALGQKIRIDILKKLRDIQNPFSFSKLQKEVLENNYTSVNFSFHLNALKKCDLIDSSENGYYITKLGKQILNNILSIEQILLDRSKTRMIRTSKYSTELFDSSKIEEYLITEGELDVYLAKQIAREVEERLTKTNIEYLTAPLMREYINAILLENGLEEVRHKLTRLGTPPYEVFKLFNSEDTEITPERFIERLGSDVSEQFLLLNVLPKKLADLYLSGEIALLHLNYWSLRPLSIYINIESLLNYIYSKNKIISHNFDNDKDYLHLISDLSNFIYKLKQVYSGDLILGDFYDRFIAKFELSENQSYIMDILSSQLLRFEEIFNDGYPHLSLGFNSDMALTNDSILYEQPMKQFLSGIMEKSEEIETPLLLFKYSDFKENNSSESIIKNLLSHPIKNNIILQNDNNLDLLNSATIKITNLGRNKIILDKILMNLHMVSIDANQSDDKFYELLQAKMESIFEFFRIKENLVKKKLNTVKVWNNMIPHMFEEIQENLLQNSIKSISFFGLNKAIQNHCGIELDRTESSTTFALSVISFMRKFIKEKNESDNDFYILTQPHKDKYLQDCWQNAASINGNFIKSYSSKIIRENLSLSLDKRISLFKKFERLLDGGSIFEQSISASDITLSKFLSILENSEINAFSLGNFENNVKLK